MPEVVQQPKQHVHPVVPFLAGILSLFCVKEGFAWLQARDENQALETQPALRELATRIGDARRAVVTCGKVLGVPQVGRETQQGAVRDLQGEISRIVSFVQGVTITTNSDGIWKLVAPGMTNSPLREATLPEAPQEAGK